MTTMNPVNYHHDPGLDPILTQSGGKPKRSGSTQDTGRSRRSQPDGYNTETLDKPPPAPDAPRGPPISYRGLPPMAERGPQRSFSQRARGRPFADEAYAEDDVADTTPEQGRRLPQPSQTSQRASGSLQVDTSHGRRPIQHTQTNLNPSKTSPRTHRGQPQVGMPKQSDMEDSASGLARSATFKDAANQTDDPARDWASDRSPLQKLEVTLNGISKEEKRARVEEAEMVARERSRSARKSELHPEFNAVVAPALTRRNPSRKAAPGVAEDSGRVRDLDNNQYSQSQRPATNSQRIDAPRSSVTRPLERNQIGDRRQNTITSYGRDEALPLMQSNDRKLDSSSQRAVSNPQSRPLQTQEKYSGPSRSVSTKQPDVTQTRSQISSSEMPRGVSMSQRMPQARLRDSDRIPTAQERNASHKAALEQLTGTGVAAVAARSSSKRSRPVNSTEASDRSRIAQADDPTKTILTSETQPEGSLSSNAQISQRTGANRTQMEEQTVGLGLQEAPEKQPMEQLQSNERPKRRQRNSSVSFKEPYDRRRPVDEWKQAETARLTAADFATIPTESRDETTAWWEQDTTPNSRKRQSNRPQTGNPDRGSAIDDKTTQFQPQLYLKCGPLLRYTGMKRTNGGSGVEGKEFWRGSVMIVTSDSQSSYQSAPTLRLFAQPKNLLPPPPAQVGDEPLAPEYVDPIAGLTKLTRTGKVAYIRPVDHLDEEKDLSRIETDEGLFESSPSPLDGIAGHETSVASVNDRKSAKDGEQLGHFKEIRGARLYADPDRDVTFWRFNLEIELGQEQQHIAYRINRGASVGFWVPARGQTMNIMFHSCNGFSLSVDSNTFSGPDPLWRDVLNNHQTRPFHVMIGGGDQIYNDRVMTETYHFAEWTKNRNPHYKHTAPFTPDMKEELETFYLERYSMWFSQGMFSVANSQIPMVNIWDDHDIIDGFGSYPDHFMQAPVFSGIGNVAYKYYMLFQHQSVEAETTADEPSWLLGYKPGPYIKQVSRSVFMEMGRHVAFLGLDCRTERKRDEVLSVDTCDLALDRCRKEVVEGQTRHLIVLLGVPIAYPRLNWLENVLTSRAMDPIKAMGRYGILKGGLLNKFDGGVEILDDLDDHWTASHHKQERNDFIKELQDLAAERSVRITILGGDVHLAAVGQFYSNPKLKVPKDRDHRYMPNIVSSAIVNTPPPEMMADIMNKRNKVHHLDIYTDESMIPMFTHDVNMKSRNNKHLLPRRNWCSITEYIPGATPPSSRATTPSFESEHTQDTEVEVPVEANNPKRRFSLSRDDVNPRMLFRRISSRNAPPSAYPNATENPNQLRSASADGIPFGGRDTSSQRSSSENRHPLFGRRSSSVGQSNTSHEGLSSRPGFHRRPTNLSEKAARKGNIPFIDDEGMEHDLNDHVNLQGGLDIVLNCEINQKDPAGITTPYRLLVPALWYDGSSDREKLDEAQGLQRKPTLLNRMGVGVKRPKGTAQNQGGNQETSDSASYSGSEEAEPPQRPKFGFFNSFRRNRKDEHPAEEYIDDRHRNDTVHQGQPQITDSNAPIQGFLPNANQHTPTDQASAAFQPTHDTGLQPQRSTRPTSRQPLPQPSTHTAPVSYSQPQSRDPNLHQKTYQPPTSDNQAHAGAREHSAPIASQPQSSVQDQRVSRQPSRPKSYIISSQPSTGSQRSSSATYTNSGLNQTPYDADSTYMRQQQCSQSQYLPPTAYPSTSAADPSYHQRSTYNSPPNQGNGPNQVPQRQLSKSDRILGISSSPADQAPHPLRGNGIIGRDIDSSNQNQRHHYSNDQDHDQHGGQQHPSSRPRPTSYETASSIGNQDDSIPRGYSGVEAYKAPKTRRRWSLREKAREWRDALDSRRRYNDEDDGQYYSDEGSQASEENYDDGNRYTTVPASGSGAGAGAGTGAWTGSGNGNARANAPSRDSGAGWVDGPGPGQAKKLQKTRR